MTLPLHNPGPALDTFLVDFQVVPFDRSAAEACGEVRRRAREAASIGSIDSLLAAHAKSMNATFVTHNMRDSPALQVLSSRTGHTGVVKAEERPPSVAMAQPFLSCR
jgi:predicted nucleic acid-binding protein